MVWIGNIELPYVHNMGTTLFHWKFENNFNINSSNYNGKNKRGQILKINCILLNKSLLSNFGLRSLEIIPKVQTWLQYIIYTIGTGVVFGVFFLVIFCILIQTIYMCVTCALDCYLYFGKDHSHGLQSNLDSDTLSLEKNKNTTDIN